MRLLVDAKSIIAIQEKISIVPINAAFSRVNNFIKLIPEKYPDTKWQFGFSCTKGVSNDQAARTESVTFPSFYSSVIFLFKLRH